MITAYPKIFALGTDYIKDIFDGEVEVTEKIDGSQFAFMKSGDQILTRSKGAIIYQDSCPKMFKKAVEYVYELSAADKLPSEMCFYGEVLDTPKHNSLTYNRVPKHNIILFGVMWVKRQAMLDYNALEHWGRLLDLEFVPRLRQGVVKSMAELQCLMEFESVLGGPKVEGVVVKNYNKPFLLGGQPIPVMAGKLVSEGFKEVNRKKWDGDKPSNRYKEFCDSFRTEARWEKAIQHLNEQGKLNNAPNDIGPLMKEINCDIISEEVDNIKRWLFNEYKNEILRTATRGFPEYYKCRLARISSFHTSEGQETTDGDN